jgi:DNA-binding transcriptional regulator GbsR (MarR family)
MDKKYQKLTDTQENYIKMYHQYFVLNWSWNEIANYWQCSKPNISKAIRWVIDNKLNLPSAYLVKGAIDAISDRLKTNKAMFYSESKKKKNRDSKFLVGLSKEIREDEKTLYELQEIIEGDKDDSTLSAAQVIKLVKEAGKTE